MNELVSVVLPIYKVETYLDRCINSVVSQTYPNLEIILIDDGSPDRCPQICDEWAKKDSRIKVVHKQNAGLGMARNTGIEHATGDYICFFDSDDYVAPDTIESCLIAALENQAELVVFGHKDVTPEMQVLATFIPHPPKKLFVGEEITHSLLPVSIYTDLRTGEDWNMVMSSWNKLYSMDVIRRSGWRFASEREIISEDFYSLTEFYGQLNRVYVLDRAFYHYTVNQSSLSRAYRPDRYERIKLFYDAMLSLSEKLGLAEILEQPIRAVTFGNIVGAMKQIVGAEHSFKRRYAELRQVLHDDFMQTLVRGTEYSGAGLQKKLLYTATKYRLVALCFLFVYIKNKRKG